MEIINWPIGKKLKAELENHYRTSFALALKNKQPWEIVSRLTFDSVAPNLKPEEVYELFDWVNRRILNSKLRGIGLELGAGACFMSATMAINPAVEKIYAVEAVENIACQLGPKIIDYVLADRSDKVSICVGEFDRLDLPNQSIDFIFDFFSLHHSDNLSQTLNEAFRVLKPGGFIFCFDKARNNKLSIDALNHLLDKEYDWKSKILMGLPPDKPHTRRQNGEKEYRLKDWQQAFLSAGFDRLDHYHLARIAGGRMSRWLKTFVSWWPIERQTKITGPIYGGKSYNHLEMSNLVFCPKVNNFPKEISLLIGYKKEPEGSGSKG